jgi:hypothetical protein
MERLDALLKELENKIEFRDISNVTVSKAGVAWHLDHSLKVINSVISTLKKSNPDDYKWKMHFKRSYLFFVGNIPRGKAKAPKSVQSLEVISKKDIERQLATAQFLITELPSFPIYSNVNHPFIGLLNLKQAIRFLEIHTKHHLKIMDEIITK